MQPYYSQGGYIQQIILYYKPVDIQSKGVYFQRRFHPLTVRNGLVPPGIDSRRKQSTVLILISIL
jgi:hypothetical protein